MTGLTNRIEDTAMHLTAKADGIEGAVLDDSADHITGLGSLRHTTIKLQCYVGPQKDVLTKLAALDSPVLTKVDQMQLREPHSLKLCQILRDHDCRRIGLGRRV